jgi:divalent metal cation (Fe/Co/Zn/Cd) transporter
VERIARTIAGVQGVHEVRLRWMGHTLHTQLQITVDEDLPTWQSHQLAEQVRHAPFEAQPKMATVLVHVDSCGYGGKDPHAFMPYRATCPP